MTTQDGTQTTEPCADCTPESVEGLDCIAKRFAKQSEVAGQHFPRLADFKVQFDTARKDYQDARDAVAADLESLTKKLAELEKDVECKLADDKEHCVKKSLRKVKYEIKECSGQTGCCAGPCEFPSASSAPSVEELAGLIAKYTRDVAISEKCFGDLIKEKTEIGTRVTALKTEVDAIAAEVAADKAGKDWARLYARVLIAKWRLSGDQLWLGHSVNSYVDCLCQALDCAGKGWERIVELEGAKAELECRENAAREACKAKKDNILGEVMKEYDKCCPPAGSDSNGNGDGDDDDDEDDDPDCDCGKHGASSAD